MRWSQVFSFSPSHSQYTLIVTRSSFKCLPEGYAMYISRENVPHAKRLVAERIAPFYWPTRGDYLEFEIYTERATRQICTLKGLTKEGVSMKIKNIPLNRNVPTFTFSATYPHP